KNPLCRTGSTLPRWIPARRPDLSLTAQREKLRCAEALHRRGSAPHTPACPPGSTTRKSRPFDRDSPLASELPSVGHGFPFLECREPVMSTVAEPRKTITVPVPTPTPAPEPAATPPPEESGEVPKDRWAMVLWVLGAFILFLHHFADWMALLLH